MTICWISTDLPVYHVTHGHSDPHARSLDVVVVQMLEDIQSKAGEGHGSSVNIHHGETLLVVRVVILKVLDYFPQKKWLEHSNGLLYERVMKHIVGTGSGLKTCFLLTALFQLLYARLVETFYFYKWLQLSLYYTWKTHTQVVFKGALCNFFTELLRKICLYFEL